MLVLERAANLGRERRARLGAVAKAACHRAASMLHEIFLEGHLALIGEHGGRRRRIAHGQKAARHAHLEREHRARSASASCLAIASRAGAECKRDVAVAELEPGVEPQRPPLGLQPATTRSRAPSPCSAFATPASVYSTVSRSGQMGRPRCSKSSPRVDDDLRASPARGTAAIRRRASPHRPLRKARRCVPCGSYRNRSSATGRSRSAARADSRRQAGRHAAREHDGAPLGTLAHEQRRRGGELIRHRRPA